MNIINILKNGELINCGMYGCIYKFKMNNKYYCIKFNFRQQEINFLNIYNKNLKNINTIPKKYFYKYHEAEIKIQKILNTINGYDINNKKLPFTIKIYNNGKITNKKIIDNIKNIIYNKYIKKNKNKSSIDEFIYFINICNEINYYVMDYLPNIQLNNIIFDNKNNLIMKDLKELHTYYFYIIYYLYLINKKYSFEHNDLHYNNILLVKDDEYEKNKIKYRIIKMNNNYYKLKIYQYRPYIIDFGFSSIYNKNIINQVIEFYEDNYDFYCLKVINKRILLNKQYNIITNLFWLFLNLICYIKYNQLDNIINYLHKNKLKILELIFKYHKDNFNKVNIILKKINNKKNKSYCHYDLYKNIFIKLTNKNVYNFIKPFKINLK